jgi:hypothetical protein
MAIRTEALVGLLFAVWGLPAEDHPPAGALRRGDGNVLGHPLSPCSHEF